MAGTTKKKLVNQNDLRRLMQERRGLSKSDERKINSPYAKYNNRGQLSCTLCNLIIKTENLWQSHVLSKIHKQNVGIGNEKESHLIGVNTCNNGKRKAEILSKESKKVCLAGKPSIVQKQLDVERITKCTTKEKLSLMQDYSSSENDSEDETKNGEEFEVTSVSNSLPEGLPPDFFEDQSEATKALSQPSEACVFKKSVDPTEKKEKEVLPANTVEDLPEGFFDDPILDAKARKVEYKDPIEEEWEKFQKTIAEESNVSEAIMEGDVEESTVERDIDQIDQQIHNWSIVKALQVKSDEINQLVKTREEGDESSASADEEDYANLLNWRAKDF